ncbi:TlpA disulfide reductase family protein [Chitinophaga sp.]|uniref:TlpA family protein disulfide reductase n=1 Tax=Chitinophaga sp. TaxID=1869181 RepID=UPI00262BA3E0|nr:TlpA disulfide reductase family protein [uncultured Chitinophaga sp.]
MKRHSCLFWALTCILTALPRITQAAPSPVTIIRGAMETSGDKMERMFLYDASEGQHMEMASSRIDGRQFTFAVQSLREGFYYVGDMSRRRMHRLYLKPGDQVALRFNDTAIAIAGGSAEGKLAAEWDKLFEEIRRPAYDFARVSMDYTGYFPLLTGFIPKAEKFKSTINTPNKAFNNLLKMVIDADIEGAALTFLYTPRGKHPDKKDYPAYYGTVVAPNKFCDSRYLRLGETDQLMRHYILFASINGATKPTKEDRLSWSLEQICNDTLKGAYLTRNFSRYNSLENFLAEAGPLEKFVATDRQRAAFDETKKKLSTFKAGEPGYNFNYPDLAGKEVSLAGLKGKVVVVDMWATWCGPCKAEIPHLKKLETDMHGKDVVFVSISVDEEKDKEKWANFVQKESLGGVQLFASGWSGMTKFYGVNAIPRFMVFDKAGKIVNVDAPRPSQPELKSLIQTLL